MGLEKLVSPRTTVMDARSGLVPQIELLQRAPFGEAPRLDAEDVGRPSRQGFEHGVGDPLRPGVGARSIL